MNTAEVRADLERTGVLFTQLDGDVGHIPDFWRTTILQLCDALDAAPQDAADRWHQEQADHAATKDELAKALAEIESMRQEVADAESAKAKAEDDRRVAVQLVSEAAPRMEALNNAMSPGWLARAAALKD